MANEENSIKIKNLINDINQLKSNPEKYKNTIERANVVLSRLRGEKVTEIMTRTGYKKGAINGWIRRFNKEKFEGLKALNNNPISNNVRNTSEDEQLLTSVNNDIEKLKKIRKDDGSKQYPNTLERLKGISGYLSDKNRNLQKIAKKIGTSTTSLNYWLTVYQKDKVKRLISFEDEPLTKSQRDNTEDAKKLETLTGEYKELLGHSDDYPNTLKRCEALMEYYDTGIAQEILAEKFKVSKTNFNSWVSTYDVFGIEGLISREPYRLSNEYSDGEYKSELLETLTQLEKVSIMQ